MKALLYVLAKAQTPRLPLLECAKAWRCFKWWFSKNEINKMKKCIQTAKKLLEDMGFREYQSDILGIALAFYRKL